MALAAMRQDGIICAIEFTRRPVKLSLDWYVVVGAVPPGPVQMDLSE
jgi:hypothetical protein